MPQAYVWKIVATVVTAGVKFVAPLVTVLVAAHFSPAQLSTLMLNPLNWGKNP